MTFAKDLNLRYPIRVHLNKLACMAMKITQPPQKHPMHWLDGSDTASGMLLMAQRLIQLETSIKRVLPSTLTRHMSITGFDQGILEVTIYNAAQAAKLRQLKNTICERLMRDGWNVKDVKLRISAARPPGQTDPKQPKQLRPLQASDLGHFEALAQGLRPGELANAVARLLRRHQT